MKKQFFLFLLLFLIVLQNCWMPPYDAQISNALYLINSMDYHGELAIDESVGGNYLSTDDIFFGSAKVFSSYTQPDSRFYFYIRDLVYVLDRKDDRLVRASYDNAGIESYVPRYDRYTRSNFSASNFYYHCYDDGNVSTTDSFQLIFYNDSYSPPRISFMNIQLNSTDYMWYESEQTNNSINEPELHAVAPYYPTDDGNILYTRTLERIGGNFTLLDYHIDNIAATGAINSSQMNQLISLPIQPEGVSLTGCRIAFVNSQQVVFSCYASEQTIKNYLVDISLGDVNDTSRYQEIGGLGTTELAVSSLSNGYILFQGRNSYDQYYFNLWRPGSSSKKLESGRLIFVDRSLHDGVYYLHFNYYRELYNEGDKRSIMVYSIKENDFIKLF